MYIKCTYLYLFIFFAIICGQAVQGSKEGGFASPRRRGQTEQGSKGGFASPGGAPGGAFVRYIYIYIYIYIHL